MLFSNFFPFARADHEGPERVVDGKYVVVLSLFPEEEGMKLQFFFRDQRTGKQLSLPVNGTVSFLEAESKTKIGDGTFRAETGKGGVTYTFPKDGLYVVTLSFTVGASEEAYMAESWQVWVPGKESGAVPAPGLSEWLGYGIAGAAVLLVIGSL